MKLVPLQFILQWNFEVTDKISNEGPRGQKYALSLPREIRLTSFMLFLAVI